MKIYEVINETIRKIGKNKWRLYSRAGDRNLGTFNSRAAAEKHEREVEYFKHIKESVKFIRPGMLRGSYTESELKKLGFIPTANGWKISSANWKIVQDIERGLLKKSDVLDKV